MKTFGWLIFLSGAAALGSLLSSAGLSANHWHPYAIMAVYSIVGTYFLIYWTPQGAKH